MEIFSESNVKFCGVDVQKVGPFLRLTCDKEYLDKNNDSCFCYNRRVRGTSPTIISILKKTSKDGKGGPEPYRPPNHDQIRKMATHAVGANAKATLRATCSKSGCNHDR